eukprot:scaffold3347_cov75-Phaeocystis_antarctica.AAC.2
MTTNTFFVHLPPGDIICAHQGFEHQGSSSIKVEHQGAGYKDCRERFTAPHLLRRKRPCHPRPARGRRTYGAATGGPPRERDANRALRVDTSAGGS